MLKISLITITYNSIKYLGSTLDSIQSQTYKNIEHIVIDGASTDGTYDILKSRISSITKLISEPDRGIYNALNKGLAITSGDVIGFLHSDDVFAHPDVLQDISKVFECDRSIDAVYGDLQYVSADNVNITKRYWRSSDFSHRKLKWGWMPPHPTLYVRRNYYFQIGGFNESYRIAADYLSVLQLFSIKNFRSAYIPEVLIKMRVGGISNQSLRLRFIKSYEDFRALKQSNVGSIFSICIVILKNLSKMYQHIIKN
jgi:glycosyltransferase involved in cell wall biosynthesis